MSTTGAGSDDTCVGTNTRTSWTPPPASSVKSVTPRANESHDGRTRAGPSITRSPPSGSSVPGVVAGAVSGAASVVTGSVTGADTAGSVTAGSVTAGSVAGAAVSAGAGVASESLSLPEQAARITAPETRRCRTLMRTSSQCGLGPVRTPPRVSSEERDRGRSCGARDAGRCGEADGEAPTDTAANRGNRHRCDHQSLGCVGEGRRRERATARRRRGEERPVERRRGRERRSGGTARRCWTRRPLTRRREPGMRRASRGRARPTANDPCE